MYIYILGIHIYMQYILCVYAYVYMQMYTIYAHVFFLPLTEYCLQIVAYPRAARDNDDHSLFFFCSKNQKYSFWKNSPILLFYFIAKFNKLLKKFRHYVKSNYSMVVSIVLYIVSADWNWKTIVLRISTENVTIFVENKLTKK